VCKKQTNIKKYCKTDFLLVFIKKSTTTEEEEEKM
jgi:hypothetical protein